MAAVLAAASGAWLARHHGSTDVALASGTWMPDARAVPQFALVDHSGRPFAADDLAGGPTLLFFGFTNCPHICPTTLAKLVQVKRDAAVRGLKVVMVSVDPERDTPDVLGKYLAGFDPELVGLTGEKAAVEKLARDLGVAHARTDLPGDTYTVDHTAAVFLLDARGKLVGIFTQPIEPKALATDLRGVADRLAG